MAMIKSKNHINHIGFRHKKCIFCLNTGVRIFENSKENGEENEYQVRYCNECHKGYYMWKLNILHIPENELHYLTDKETALKLKKELCPDDDPI